MKTKLNNKGKPSKLIISILLLSLVMCCLSCSKSEILEEPTNKGMNDLGYTGILFERVYGFDADRVTINLRDGEIFLGEYGQSLKRFSHIELKTGTMIMYGAKVFKGSDEIDFKMFTIKDGQTKKIKKTTLIKTIKGKHLTIYIKAP
jgi:hypothetical protein